MQTIFLPWEGEIVITQLWNINFFSFFFSVNIASYIALNITYLSLKITLAWLKNGDSLLSIAWNHVYLCDCLEAVHKSEWPWKWLVLQQESPRFTLARAKKGIVGFMLLPSPKRVSMLTDSELSSNFFWFLTPLFWLLDLIIFARKQVLNIISCLSLYVVSSKWVYVKLRIQDLLS